MHTSLPVPGYRAITNILDTGPGPPHALDCLTHIDCYMDDVITVVQGRPERQRQVFNSTFQALKWLFPSLPGEFKGSVITKKLKTGKGDWTCVKEVLGRTIVTEAGTVALPKRKLHEQTQLLAIPAIQRGIGQKELERLVGNLCSMHLAVPGVLAHLYHIQRTLVQ